jgi:hypothetical protein
VELYHRLWNPRDKDISHASATNDSFSRSESVLKPMFAKGRLRIENFMLWDSRDYL